MSPKVRVLVIFMKSNLRCELTLHDLGAMVELSNSRLNTLFKVEVGMAPLQYHKMLRLEEARALLALGLDDGLPAMRAHGVRELRDYLAGATSLKDAMGKAKTETRRYAKRQMTWLRRYMADWEWFPDAAAAVEATKARLLTP